MFATEQPINLAELLDGLEYPVATIEVIAHAEDMDASEEALELLRGLPSDREFDNFQEIHRCLGLMAPLPGNENIWASIDPGVETL